MIEVFLLRLAEGFPVNIPHSTNITFLRARMIADSEDPARHRFEGGSERRVSLDLPHRPVTYVLGTFCRLVGPVSGHGYSRRRKAIPALSDGDRHQHLHPQPHDDGVKFLFQVTLRRHDPVADIFSLKDPVKIPLVLSRNEVKRILLMASSQKARVMLSLAYGCGVHAGEVVRLPRNPCPDVSGTSVQIHRNTQVQRLTLKTRCMKVSYRRCGMRGCTRGE